MSEGRPRELYGITEWNVPPMLTAMHADRIIIAASEETQANGSSRFCAKG